ncbi:MAG: hypothetical protein KBD94_04455 [Pyrinomonadaceae bacterium]|nr:hypothetical protein [Pyrinomonadaceae bacterium]
MELIDSNHFAIPLQNSKGEKTTSAIDVKGFSQICVAAKVDQTCDITLEVKAHFDPQLSERGIVIEHPPVIGRAVDGTGQAVVICPSLANPILIRVEVSSVPSSGSAGVDWAVWGNKRQV